jgi:hypothetical protein
VLDAIGDRTGLVVACQSFGGVTRPLVCDRVAANLLVLVAGMIPSPGEAPADYWTNTRYEQEAREHYEDPIDLFSTTFCMRAGGRGAEMGTCSVRGSDERTVASRGLARGSHSHPVVSGRPTVSCQLPSPRRSRALRNISRRDRRRTLHRPEPSKELADRLDGFPAGNL